MPIIATVLAALSRLFASRIAQWIASALIFFGLTYGSQKVAVQPILAQIQAVAGGLTSSAIGWAAFFNIDKAISIVLSAHAVRWSMSAARVWLKRRSAG